MNNTIRSIYMKAKTENMEITHIQHQRDVQFQDDLQYCKQEKAKVEPIKIAGNKQ